MKNTKGIARQQEVLISDERISKSELAATVIPKGYRQATLEEVALSYRNDINFRNKLYETTVLTSQIGLLSPGFHKINDDGTFSKIPEKFFYEPPANKFRIIPEDTFYLLPEVERAHLYSEGHYPVKVWANSERYISLEPRLRLLVVAAKRDLIDESMNVAYVKEDVSPLISKISIPVTDYLAAREAFGKLEPMIRGDLAYALRKIFRE